MRNLYFNEEKELTQDPSKPCSISSSQSDIQNRPADTPYSEKQNDITNTLYQLSPRCQLIPERYFHFPKCLQFIFI